MALFSELLRDWRLRRRMTQQGLAEKTGLSRCYIALLEQGTKKNPTQKVQKKLAEALNLSGIEKQKFFLSLQQISPKKPSNEYSESPAIKIFAEFLALPPDSPNAWEKLKSVYERLFAILEQKGLTSEQKKKSEVFSLLTQGYAYTSDQSSETGKKTKRQKRLPRSQRDKANLAIRLHSLLGIFVNGNLPMSDRAALAEELLSMARWKQDEIEKKMQRSRNRGGTK